MCIPSEFPFDSILANPHYKPETQAQTTLINFTVTRGGLEDQILADVINFERPDQELLKVIAWCFLFKYHPITK